MKRAALVALVAAGSFACGTSSPTPGFVTDPDAGTPGPSPGGDDSGSTPIVVGGGFDGSIGGGTVDAASNQIAVVYGESPDTLYSLDPDTKAVNVVGAFSGCSSVEDIALDKDSNMYATTSNALYRVDTSNAKCTLIANGSYPNSLSFVPAGTLDPNVEALVGYNGGTYVRIDTKSGAVTTVGSIGGGFSSSGDIVSVIGGATYLTVTGTGCSTNDCLIEVDPKTGALVKNWKSVAHNQVFGLSFWAGALYGFDDGGDLFEIDLTNGVLTTKTITVPNAPSGLEFWGAGSTTSAPVSPPAK